MSLGEWLKEERRRVGLSQAGLGALIGGSERGVQDWERGVSQPNATYLTAMAAAGMDVLYVLSGVRMSEEQLEVSALAARATLDATAKSSDRDRLAQLNIEAMRLALVPPISAGETDLVRRYRALGPDGQVAVERMIEALGGVPASPVQSPVTKKRSKVTIHGDVGQQVKGDAHNFGTFVVGGKKPRRGG